jgi:hypothetical protein
MKSKAVILNLRVAIGTDFTNELGGKKYGCMYFQQNRDGTFCNQPYFFHENTDLQIFRELYQSNQIWVLAGIFDKVEYLEIRKPIIKSDYIKQKNSSKRSRPCTCIHKKK